MFTKPTLTTSDDLLICNACGTQIDVTSSFNKPDCKICDDPRQFVPPEGQSYTTLSKLRSSGHRNVWTQDLLNPKIWSMKTKPSFAIGQRAMFIQTEHGNVLWDMITLLDEETVDKIAALGGLSAIIVSHPHYYTTLSDWAATFPSTPIYTGALDKTWLSRPAPPNLHFLTKLHTQLPSIPSLTAVLSGGHFPGSLCLYWSTQKSLFIADTILTVPSATNPAPGKPGVISYTWWYSVPNRIPLSPREIWSVWESVRDLDWDVTYGAFMGMNVRESGEERARGTGGVKGRMRESMRIFVGGMGWTGKEMKKEVEALERILGECDARHQASFEDISIEV